MNLFSDRIKFSSTVDWDDVIIKREDGCWDTIIKDQDSMLARNKHIIKRLIFEHYTGQNTNSLKGFRHCNFINCVNPDHYEYVSHMDKLKKKRDIMEEKLRKAKEGY